MDSCWFRSHLGKGQDFFLCSTHVQTHTYGHELWGRTRSRIQLTKRCFPCWVCRLSLRDKARSSDVWREFAMELLILHVEISQLRWFECLVRIFPGCFPLQGFPTSRNPRVDPEIRYLKWFGNVSGCTRSWKTLLRKRMFGTPH